MQPPPIVLSLTQTQKGEFLQWFTASFGYRNGDQSLVERIVSHLTHIFSDVANAEFSKRHSWTLTKDCPPTADDGLETVMAENRVVCLNRHGKMCFEFWAHVAEDPARYPAWVKLPSYPAIPPADEYREKFEAGVLRPLKLPAHYAEHGGYEDPQSEVAWQTYQLTTPRSR